MQHKKGKRNQWLVWLRWFAEIAGVLYTAVAGAEIKVDVTVKIISLLHH